MYFVFKIEQHLDIGGNDDPAEVLYTFFFRYGAVKHSNPKISSLCRTVLSQNTVIKTKDGVSIDFKNVFQIQSCVIMFEACWRILHKRLNGRFNRHHSMIQYFIDATKLNIVRCKYKKLAESKLREIAGQSFYGPSQNYPDREGDGLLDFEAIELIKSYGQDVEEFRPYENTSYKRRRNSRTKSKRRKKKKNDVPE
jgi:hypothetical protein